MGRLLAREVWARDSTFVGIGYFYAGHLVATGFAEPRARALGADPHLLSEIRSALCRLVDPESLSTPTGDPSAEPASDASAQNATRS